MHLISYLGEKRGVHLRMISNPTVQLILQVWGEMSFTRWLRLARRKVFPQIIDTTPASSIFPALDSGAQQVSRIEEMKQVCGFSQPSP